MKEKNTESKKSPPKLSIPVHLRVIRCLSISPQAKAIFLVIWEKAWFNRYYGGKSSIFPGQKYLGEVTGGASENTVRKYVHELVGLKMIKVISRPGRSNLYKVRPERKWRVPRIESKQKMNPLRFNATDGSESLEGHRRKHLVPVPQSLRTTIKASKKLSEKRKEKIGSGKTSSTRREESRRKIRHYLETGRHKEVPALARQLCQYHGPTVQTAIKSEVESSDQFYNKKGHGFRKLTLQGVTRETELGIAEWKAGRLAPSGKKRYRSSVSINSNLRRVLRKKRQ